jgi:FixJ family two-component response regulator
LPTRASATKCGSAKCQVLRTRRPTSPLNDQIAERLFLSPFTVKTHINRAMMKLAVRARAQLVVLAYQTGLVRPGDSID